MGGGRNGRCNYRRLPLTLINKESASGNLGGPIGVLFVWFLFVFGQLCYFLGKKRSKIYKLNLSSRKN